METTTLVQPEETTYKNNPLIVLNPDQKFPFQFGLTKAKLIIAHIESIKEFVDKHDKENGS